MASAVPPSVQTVVSAARQGASYGARIRLPHAFVMTVLFQKGTWESKIRRIVEMALVHGRNLAMYAATYKALLALLAAFSSPASSPTSHLPTGRLTQPGLLPTGSASSPLHRPSPSGSQSAISPPGRPTASWHPLVAGGIGGYVVWGAYSGVNYQISLYVLSRVLVASLRLLARQKVYPFKAISFDSAYPFGTAVTWAAVMYLWESHPDLLQSSLKASMDFIYRQGETDIPWKPGGRAALASAVPSVPYLAVLAASAALKLRGSPTASGP